MPVPRFIPFVTFILVLLIHFVSPALALDLKDVRFGAHPDKTRVVIELSEKINFKAFILPAEANRPYRLVVDLPDFNWKAGSIPPPKKTTVQDVRSGTLKSGIKRLVIDLRKPAQIKKAFILPADSRKPTRLVIDFKTISRQAFAATSRKTLGSLNVGSPDLKTIIAKQTGTTNKTKKLKNISPKGIITPPRKPTTTKIKQPIKRKAPQRKPLIVIDAGHGGADPGAPGANHTHEKNVTLSTSKELKRQLERTGRYRVTLTRSKDKYLKLYKRVSIARKKEADLFISLHADSIGKSNIRGASIYTLSNKASDAQTAKLAARENQVDLIAGVDLSHEDKDVANILIDLAMRDTMNQSTFFANTVVSKMRSHHIRLLQKPHRYAGFAVLKAPDIPSVLIEMGFMSNKKEAQLLSTSSYQQKIAAAVTDSVNAYFTKIRKNKDQ